MRLNTKKVLEMFIDVEETIENRKNGWTTSVYLLTREVGGIHILKNNYLLYDIRYDGSTTYKYYLNDRHRVIFESQSDVNVILPELIRLADAHDEWEKNASKEEVELFYNPRTEKDIWKDSLKNKDWNTITLRGVREVEVFVVSDEVFDLITGNTQTHEAKEEALDYIWNTMDITEQEEYVSKDSFIEEMENARNDNDRATHLRCERFWCDKEAKSFFKKNKIKIKQKYEGYIN